ncbi:MAG: sigma-70 family RNA polymerase sigma factor [Oscillospiraceae bacterium]|nr:sigma-70 family RNA polymerase sigma factor [Oscillospiraceae bacterium]
MNQKITQAVTALQNGDHKAFETLYKEFSQSAYFLALKLMKNPQEAEDVTQEVFIKVFQKIGELKDPMAFPAWFKRITVNQCTDMLKKNNVLTISAEEETELDFLEETDIELIPDKSLDNAETARLIVEIIDRLPPPQKVCVYYYYYEQLSVNDIAESLSVGKNTIKTRLSLAREKIGKELKKLEEKEGIKLYSIAPFVIPALLRTMQETEVPAHLLTNITAEIGILSATAATVTTTAVMTFKTKVLIAAGSVAVTGTVIAGIVIGNTGDDFQDVYVPSEITTAVTDTIITTEYEPPQTTTIVTTTEPEPLQTEPEQSEPEETTAATTAATTTATTTAATTVATTAATTAATTTAATTATTTVTTAPQVITEPPTLSLSIGDIIQLGGHDWRVIDIQNGRALIISERVITTRQYHSDRRVDVTWENSDIRAWLNGEFYNNTFSAAEKNMIAQTRVENMNNQWHGTSGGNATTDRVFLLSLEEVVRYFGDSGQLNTRSSSPINDEFNSARTATFDGRNRWWWVRSPGNGSNRAANINNNGFIDVSGDHVDNNNGGIRPALWLIL